MDKEAVERMATEAAGPPGVHDYLWKSWSMGMSDPKYPSTNESLLRFAASIRTAALEEAAKVCESLWDLRDDERARMHAAKCAAAIRALAQEK